MTKLRESLKIKLFPCFLNHFQRFRGQIRTFKKIFIPLDLKIILVCFIFFCEKILKDYLFQVRPRFWQNMCVQVNLTHNFFGSI